MQLTTNFAHTCQRTRLQHLTFLHQPPRAVLDCLCRPSHQLYWCDGKSMEFSQCELFCLSAGLLVRWARRHKLHAHSSLVAICDSSFLGDLIFCFQSWWHKWSSHLVWPFHSSGWFSLELYYVSLMGNCLSVCHPLKVTSLRWLTLLALICCSSTKMACLEHSLAENDF